MICILAPFNPYSLKQYLSYKTCCIPNINSSATSINNLVKGLIDNGKSVTVITLDYSSKKTIRIYGAKLNVIIIGCSSFFKFNNLFPNLRRVSKLLVEEINTFIDKVDILHSHWCYEYSLAAKCFISSKVVITTVRDFAPVIYDSINIRDSIYSFFAKFYWKYKCKIFEEIIHTQQLNLVSNSEYTAIKLKSYLPNIKCTTIPNSIEDELLFDVLPNTHGRKLIVSIAASLDDNRKNIRVLLDAFSMLNKEFNGYKLILIGNYHQQGGVYEYAARIGIIDDVVFTGRINRTEIISIIDKSIVMVHPALEETFGNILLEAMARGVLCIGGLSSGAVPYVLGNGNSGVLCNVTSQYEIFESMKKLISCPEQYDPIRQNALNRVAGLYSNTAVAKQHIQLYNKLHNLHNE